MIYKNYLMRDRDIRNIIHKITNNSSELNNNWQHPQKLSFNNNSSNWLTRFKQNYINVTTDIDDIDRLMYNYQSRVSSSKSRAADQEQVLPAHLAVT